MYLSLTKRTIETPIYYLSFNFHGHKNTNKTKNLKKQKLSDPRKAMLIRYYFE